jgi:hypothetical protein
MTRSLTSIAAACATALVLAGAAAAPANAYYLGYGNGDATNEDFWAEQGVVEPAPSPSPRGHIRTTHQHTSAHHHSAPARPNEMKQY